MQGKLRRRKGVSPVIATVLLIAIVIVLALIVFLWARGFVKEAVQKKGKPAEQACSEVNLEVAYLKTEGKLQLTNRGNIPIYSFDLKMKSAGKTDTKHSDTRLAMGQSVVISDLSGYDEIEVFPSILGEGKTSKKVYVCKNSFVAS